MLYDLPPLDSIVSALKSLKLSQPTIAAGAGISQATVAQMYKGRDLRYSTVLKVCGFIRRQLKGDEGDLMAGDICARELVSVTVSDTLRAAVEKMIGGGFDQLPVFERKELVGAIVHQDLMQRVAGGQDLAEMVNRPVREFMRPPFPVVDEGESAGILKMLLLHRQAVLVRIGGKVGGIVTWADVLDLRKTKAGSVGHLNSEP